MFFVTRNFVEQFLLCCCVNIYIKIRNINSNMKTNISKKYIEKENFYNNRILGYKTNKINQYTITITYVKFLSFRNKLHKIKNKIALCAHDFQYFVSLPICFKNKLCNFYFYFILYFISIYS